MNTPSVKSNISCTCISLFLSIIVGIVGGVFQAVGIIAVTNFNVLAVFAVATAYLGITLLTSAITKIHYCCEKAMSRLLTGIVGTIVISSIMLITGISFFTVIYAIFTGILMLFATLMITSTVCVIRCRSHIAD